METQFELVVLDGPEQATLGVGTSLDQGMKLCAVDRQAPTTYVLGLVHGAVRRGEQR